MANGIRSSKTAGTGQLPLSDAGFRPCPRMCGYPSIILDVAVQQLHSEGRSGQFEISLAPLPSMEAVDTLVLTQEVIKNVALKYGHEATM